MTSFLNLPGVVQPQGFLRQLGKRYASTTMGRFGFSKFIAGKGMLERCPHLQRSTAKINIAPFQRKQFALPHPCGQRQDEERLESITNCRGKEGACLFLRQRCHFMMPHTRSIYQIAIEGLVTLRAWLIGREEPQPLAAPACDDGRHLVERELPARDIHTQVNLTYLEDANTLPAPGVLAASILEDLQAALEQFAAIADDLSVDVTGDE
jgi:hypothetical protein